ncbi:class I SAM-dependent methyltransferase [Labrys sp. (in: a-proteobacteria)]|uniref:class I SAM-dependent methyltransferase n=1 Tax=Labrys sp. (in: a-proteobacteria) TaxID=1917972 RepID=UPI0039E42C97
MNELSAHYTDPRLVDLYDMQNPWGPDSDFYLALAGRPALAILDIGCGTGMMATAFARQGHAVTAVDPAAAMLDVARSRPQGQLVRWVHGLVGEVQGSFDLAVMTGHAFQVLLDDETTLAFLRAVKQRLSPGGRFAFETRNPDARIWEEWAKPLVGSSVAGATETAHVDIEKQGELVSFRSIYRFDDGTEVSSRSTLRFASQATISALAEKAGFSRQIWYGDWDRQPVEAGSRELILVAGFA